MSGRIRIGTTKLDVGRVLKQSIHSINGELIASAGSKITVRLKEQLLDHKVNEVLVHWDDLKLWGIPLDTLDAVAASGIATESIATLMSLSKLDELLARTSRTVENRGAAVQDTMPDHKTTPYDSSQNERLSSQLERCLEAIRSLTAKLIDGEKVPRQEVEEVADSQLTELQRDQDHLIHLSISSRFAPEFEDHSLQLSTLSMAMGVQAGYDRRHVLSVGSAALIHDWGLAEMAPQLRDPTFVMSQEEWRTYRTHPLQTLELIGSIEGLPETVALAAAQVHEQPDGSGFPKGLHEADIHPYAKLIGVAEEYLTLIAPGRGRAAMVPYDAVSLLIHKAHHKKLDSDSVRSLLKVVSLFPIGSRVRLDDDSIAWVVRCNPDKYSLPILDLAPDGPEPQLVRLSEHPAQIAVALADPDRKQEKLTREAILKLIKDDG